MLNVSMNSHMLTEPDFLGMNIEPNITKANMPDTNSNELRGTSLNARIMSLPGLINTVTKLKITDSVTAKTIFSKSTAK